MKSFMKSFKELMNEKQKPIKIGDDSGYEVLSSDPDREGSYIVIKYKGKQVSSGDFDIGSDSFFIDVPGKGNKSVSKSFNTVGDMIKYFKDAKIITKVD